MIIKAKKLNMTQIFKDDEALGATIIQLDPEVQIDSLKPGDLVKVSGISKGKGFAGVVKRHGFSGGPKTHGQKNRHRAPGSIGSTAPQRVLPGRRMAGRMGGGRVSVKNIKIVGVDAEKKILVLGGAVPGNKGGQLLITKK